MTLARPMFPPAAGLTHASSRVRRTCRPRFKTGLLAASETVLPPPTEHLDEHTQFGRDRYDPAASAERDGRLALAALIRLRQEMADRIEEYLEFLDRTDGAEDDYDDAEPTDAQIRKHSSPYWAQEDDEDGGDSEPSLGWCRGGALGVDDDRELELSPL